MVSASTALAQKHRVVVVETLHAAGMRSAGGARKRGLNRALADAALAEVRRMLGYKTRWYGSHLEEADRYFPSSKTCTGCGRRKPNLTLADRVFDCEHCGTRIDRDLGAAINLARLGDHQKATATPRAAGTPRTVRAIPTARRPWRTAARGRRGRRGRGRAR
ncbi:zinc ribbon domain-containing protein [Mycolicibacterium goodii]|uniref:RNA-guided endonuclease InsQ/TnpB family protein n=1 Tax=Mycolicibacterium goodii TaxID=134601 RepID=UPI001FEF4F7C|nr:zinc ribbon domain-containing protein [Mycolicibacterium goodii]ULN49255.1 zinc ribbon domain-containing protein [Mycolicibacterium goodii]